MGMDMQTKLVGVIYETYDYNKFRKAEGNRDVVQARKNKVLESFSTKIIENPIIVTNDMEIIDGQARYEACKQMGLPIHYIVDTNATANDCALLNAYSTSWTTSDYCNQYAVENENYKRLKEISEETGITVNKIVTSIFHSAWSSGIKKLKDGEFVFTEEQSEIALDVIGYYKEIIEALCITGRINSSFLRGVSIMVKEFPEHDRKRMLRRCKVERGSFVMMSNLKNTLVEFSRIYNSKCKSNTRIRFEDYLNNKGYNVRGYDNCGAVYDAFNKDSVQTLVGGDKQ